MISYIIIGITALVSYNAFNRTELKYRFLFNPFQVFHRKEYRRIITHGFIHADWNHLIFNMVTLFFFGPIAESIFSQVFPGAGTIHFLILYIGGMSIASLPSLIKHKDNAGYNSLGASGAVSAVLFTYILFDPLGTIRLFFAIPIPAILLGVGYMWYSAYMAKKNVDNIGHDAHLWGGIFGFLYPLLIEPSIFTEIFLGKLFGIF